MLSCSPYFFLEMGESVSFAVSVVEGENDEGMM
jgi:hypothetical protein